MFSELERDGLHPAIFIALICPAYTLYFDCANKSVVRSLPKSDYICLSGMDHIDTNGRLAIKRRSLEWASRINGDSLDLFRAIAQAWYLALESLYGVSKSIEDIFIALPGHARYYPSSELKISSFESCKPSISEFPDSFFVYVSLRNVTELNKLRHPDFFKQFRLEAYDCALVRIVLDESEFDFEHEDPVSKSLLFPVSTYLRLSEYEWIGRYHVTEYIPFDHACRIVIPNELMAFKKIVGENGISYAFYLMEELLDSYVMSYLKHGMMLQSILNCSSARYYSPLKIGV